MHIPFTSDVIFHSWFIFSAFLLLAIAIRSYITSELIRDVKSYFCAYLQS